MDFLMFQVPSVSLISVDTPLAGTLILHSSASEKSIANSSRCTELTKSLPITGSTILMAPTESSVSGPDPTSGKVS